MARSYPPDVVVLDTDSLVHARFAKGSHGPRLVMAKSYRLAVDTFTNALVTPEVTNESSLAEALRRLRNETGRWNRLSLLLPDSWFRINLLDVPSLPDKPGEAMEVVRWSLKRTLPVDAQDLRIAYHVLARTPGAVKILAISAVEKSLAQIERIFIAAGFDVILLEPVGLNIWNAIAVREAETPGDRLFVYVRDTDFTTAVFRGHQPLFIRSRNLSGERTVPQELRLSASYLRDQLRAEGVEKCYLAGNRIDSEVTEALASEFGAPVQPIALRDYVQDAPADAAGLEAELTACTGVFTG